MSIFSKLKGIITHQERLNSAESNDNIYEKLGIVKPFTVLADDQFNNFIAALANNRSKSLNDSEQGAFDALWNAACVDIFGDGNNIINLKMGSFEIYNKDGVIVTYEKKKAEVKPKYEYSTNDGRANFVYLSGYGNFIINQNDRNKKVFLVYVSENISDRLLSILSEAEAEVLGLSPESSQERKRLGIPTSLQEKYRVDSMEGKSNNLTDPSKNVEASEIDER